MSKLIIISLLLIVEFIAGCSTKGKHTYKNYNEQEYTNYSNNNSMTKKSKHYTMKPYVIKGIRYHPTNVNIGDIFKGNASWYGPHFNGRPTSSGEVYDMWKMTAAHKTLPMNTMVKVTNLRNGLSTIVRINDRGPFVATRIIDLSKAAAKKINMVGHGIVPIKLEIIGFKTRSSNNIAVKKDNTGYLALQIASFSNINSAFSMQEKYNNRDGYKSIIIDKKTDNSRIFKVLLIGFKSEQEARDYKFNGPFKNSFIVRERD